MDYRIHVVDHNSIHESMGQQIEGCAGSSGVWFDIPTSLQAIRFNDVA